MAKHSAAVAHLCSWRRWVALFVATVTSGSWIPFVTIDQPDPPRDEETSVSVPPPIHEWHPPLSWPLPTTPPPPAKHHRPPLHKPSEHRPQHEHNPPPVTKPVPTKADRTASILLSFLRAQVGKPYVWGGNGPNVWDCSGLTKAAYARLGIYLPRTSEEQSLVGERVSLSHLEVGDLLFWGSPGFAFHVAIYVGHGKYIAAQNPHSGVMQLSLSYYHPSFARRVL